ncbi:MAG: amidohydrolase family protein [Verrucomicrobia bacterium]|nr:amidohydrolase family protein [Verrucomicrobiota bacterium]
MSPPGEVPPEVDAHTHLYSGLAGLGLPTPSPRPSFPEILRTVWWRLDRALDRASLRASARLAVAEGLLAGTTTFFDHHESPAWIEGSLDVLAEACTELGARALLCYGVTERNGGDDEARRGLDECARFCALHRGHPTVRGAVGLHASFTVSDATLRRAGVLARDLGVPVHVHVAEDPCDDEDARARGHGSALDRLLGLDAVPWGSVLAHGVHLSTEQVERCAERGLWLVQNPRSNAHNGVGWARTLVASPRVALGTDGFRADMAEEAAAFGAEALAHGDDPRRARALVDGGRALAAAVFGGLEGDRVVRVGDHVVEVDVAGAPVVRGGTLVRASLASIEAEARREAPRLFRRMEEIPC